MLTTVSEIPASLAARRVALVVAIAALALFALACSAGNSAEFAAQAEAAQKAAEAAQQAADSASAAAVAANAAAASIAAPEPADPGELVLYSGRSESLVAPVIEQFREATGIDVQVKYGGTSEIAATIAEEGGNSPADVFWAQDPGALAALRDRYRPLPSDITLAVPEWGAGIRRQLGRRYRKGARYRL